MGLPAPQGLIALAISHQAEDPTPGPFPFPTHFSLLSFQGPHQLEINH